MNADPENFDALKKLLALKRHEQPPPGYFNELPQQIWKRIEAKEAQPSFWERIFGGVALKPAVAYAFGLVVCGTLIFGIGSALNSEKPSPVAATPLPQQQTLQVIPPGLGIAEAKPNLNPARETSATNPVITPDFFKPAVPNEVFSQPASASPQ